MHVFLVGAGGFIGSALARALAGDGHRITAFGRDLGHGRRILPNVHWVRGDLRDMTTPDGWTGHLRGVDIVINASGALQSGLRDDVAGVQRDAIVALTTAAQAAGVQHFIQISAAGAERSADTDFMTSKAEADDAIARSGLPATILKPGLVIGRNAFGGTELLRAAAGIPFVALDIQGTGDIQCVALEDVVAAVRGVIAGPAGHVGCFDLVEETGRSLGEIIERHRSWLGLPEARWRLPVSTGLIHPLSLLADLLGWLGWRSPLRSNAIAALTNGVQGEARQAHALLGRAPLTLPETLLALGLAGKADRWHARLALLYPLALAVLVTVWIGSGVLGLLFANAAAGLLEAGGMGSGPARFLVLSGSFADLLIGLALAFRPTLALALKAGVALALAYVGASLWARPDLWLDPLAPLLKVLPMLVLMLMCLAVAEER